MSFGPATAFLSCCATSQGKLNVQSSCNLHGCKQYRVPLRRAAGKRGGRAGRAAQAAKRAREPVRSAAAHLVRSCTIIRRHALCPLETSSLRLASSSRDVAVASSRRASASSASRRSGVRRLPARLCASSNTLFLSIPDLPTRQSFPCPRRSHYAGRRAAGGAVCEEPAPAVQRLPGQRGVHLLLLTHDRGHSPLPARRRARSVQRWLRLRLPSAGRPPSSAVWLVGGRSARAFP